MEEPEDADLPSAADGDNDAHASHTNAYEEEDDDEEDSELDETGSNAWHTEADEAAASALRELTQRVATVSVEKERLQAQLEKTEIMQAQLVNLLRHTSAMLHKLHDQYVRQTQSNEQLIAKVGKWSKPDYDKFLISSLNESEDKEVTAEYAALMDNIEEVLQQVTRASAATATAAAGDNGASPSGEPSEGQTLGPLELPRKSSADSGAGVRLSANSSAAASRASVQQTLYTEADVVVPPLWSPYTFSKRLITPATHQVDCLLPNLQRNPPPKT